jgi:recombination protein RecA
MIENTEEILEQQSEEPKKKGRKPKDKEEKETKTEYEKVINALEKDFGANIVQQTDGAPRYEQVATTGSLKIDEATGIGGVPITGCVIEIMGWESCGKSTISQQVVGEIQKATKKRALYIDGENSFDNDYAEVLGVDLSKLDISQPECGEDAYTIAEKLMDTGEYGVVVIDSQTSLLPKKQITDAIGASNLGLHARLMSQAVPRLNRASRRNKCVVIIISQFREKIGVMYGSPETTSGGNALKFYAHMRWVIRRAVEKDEGKESNQKISVKIIKNKFAPPFGKAEGVFINFGEGVDRIRETFDLAVDNDIIVRGGAWYTYGEDKWQGEDTVIDLLRDNEELYQEVREKVIKKLSE